MACTAHCKLLGRKPRLLQVSAANVAYCSDAVRFFGTPPCPVWLWFLVRIASHNCPRTALQLAVASQQLLHTVMLRLLHHHRTRDRPRLLHYRRLLPPSLLCHWHLAPILCIFRAQGDAYNTFVPRLSYEVSITCCDAFNQSYQPLFLSLFHRCLRRATRTRRCLCRG